MIVWGGSRESYDYVDTGAVYDPVIDAWSRMSEVGAPSPRCDHGAVWTGQEMIIWGGLYIDMANPWEPQYLSTGGRFDPVTDTWLPTSMIDRPPGRSEVVPVWTGSEMIVWGGRSDVAYLEGNCHLYNPATDTWRESADDVPTDTYIGYSAVWTGSEMIIWGGYNWDGGHYSSFGYHYDPVADDWSGLISSPLAARANHTSVWTGTEVVVWGGVNSSGGSTYLADGARWNPSTWQWTAMSATGAPEGRSSHSANWTGDRMIVWGGTRDNGKLDNGAIYDPQADNWVPMSGDGAPSRRAGHTTVWTGDEILVWGGRGPGVIRVQSGGRYLVANDSWAALPVGYPDDRFDHTVVWTGVEMIVWGGTDSARIENVNSGGLYDPVLDVWRQTALTNAPAPRSVHSAVWADGEMIVWGGREGPLPEHPRMASGGRYDPVTDSWVETTEIGAPEARCDHRAVWTGAEMIVWGGTRALWDYLDTGASYDPLGDTWAPTSLDSSPSGRDDFSMVWTGDEAIVWGGYGDNFDEQTGGRYDPGTNSWQPTSLLDAPSRRSRHTAIWTGDEMVVWGGGAGTTGGLYDPSTDEWRETKVNGAPSQRYDHSAVWTGEHMIVWGGDETASTGGVFDPARNTWFPTSIHGAPTERDRHTAVWTGERMLVWGGIPSGNLGSFDPAMPIFWDNFESGDNRYWSGVAP
jgi:N-acetylneuraminic acid mutarotase